VNTLGLAAFLPAFPFWTAHFAQFINICRFNSACFSSLPGPVCHFLLIAARMSTSPSSSAAVCAACTRERSPRHFDAAQLRRKGAGPVCRDCATGSGGGQSSAVSPSADDAKGDESDPMFSFRSLAVLGGLLCLNFAIAFFGAMATIPNVNGWYARAKKAPWSPPNGVFGPVWTVLYIAMAVAAWLVWRQRPNHSTEGSGKAAGGTARVDRALCLYFIQLTLNAAWSPTFFALYPIFGSAALWSALAIILALDWLVGRMVRAFRPLSPLAARLMQPYWAWILFATTLNAYIALYN